MSYDWLKKETAPKILVEAVKHIGTKEIIGKAHNKKILGWAEALGLKSVYTNDEIPWCGLFVAYCCHAQGLDVVKAPLWALNWNKYGNVAQVPMLLVANPNLAAKNIAELIALAKKEPDTLSYASFGNGSASHLAGALLTNQAGIKMTHIPYKGGGPAITDALGGQVPMSFSAFGVALPHVKSGKLIALGTTGPTRAKLLPDVPTIEESGNLKGYEMSIVYAVWAPAGMPAPIISKLTKALEQVVASSAFKEKVTNDGGEVMNLSTPAESNAYFQKEMQRLSKIVKDGNIKAD